MKHTLHQGEVYTYPCIAHQFAFTGSFPNSGERRCVYCGKPAGVPDDQPDHPRN